MAFSHAPVARRMTRYNRSCVPAQEIERECRISEIEGESRISRFNVSVKRNPPGVNSQGIRLGMPLDGMSLIDATALQIRGSEIDYPDTNYDVCL